MSSDNVKQDKRAELTVIPTYMLDDLYNVLSASGQDSSEHTDWVKARAVQVLIRNAKAASKPFTPEGLTKEVSNKLPIVPNVNEVLGEIIHRAYFNLGLNQFRDKFGSDLTDLVLSGAKTVKDFAKSADVDEKGDSGVNTEYSLDKFPPLKPTYTVIIYHNSKINSSNVPQLIKWLRQSASLGLQDAYMMIQAISKENGQVDVDNFTSFEEALDLYWNLYLAGFHVNIHSSNGKLIYGAVFNDTDKWGNLTDFEYRVAREKLNYYTNSKKEDNSDDIGEDENDDDFDSDDNLDYREMPY